MAWDCCGIENPDDVKTCPVCGAEKRAWTVLYDRTRLFTIGAPKGWLEIELVDLRVPGIETVGDVIDRINFFHSGVEARINDRGDGIAIVDTAEGDGTLSVTSVNGSRTSTRRSSKS